MCVHVSVHQMVQDSELCFSSLEEESVFTLPCMKPVMSCRDFTHSFVHSFVRSFIRCLQTKVLTEPLPYAVHCARRWGNNSEGDGFSP